MSSLDPEDDRLFLSSVEALLEQRLFDRVQELAGQRLRGLPDDVAARIALCKVGTKMGRLDQVEEILREVEERITEWSRVYAAMGDLCRASGLKREAVRFYRRFLVLHPQGPAHETVTERLARLVAAGMMTPLPDTSEDHYEDIMEIAPDFHTMTLAELYLRQNQLEMARNVLNEIILREPDHAQAAVRLREIENRLSAAQGDPDRQGHEKIFRELSRWLQNIGRIGNYAT
jgi:tetratricopeptide (TPR) repeat protein